MGVLWTLAQLDPESAAAKWFWGVSSIMVIGAIAVLIIVAVGVGRRWKRRQLQAIEQDKAQRRAHKTGERVDAWAASSDRYIDHDKFVEEDEDETFEHRNDSDDDDPDDAPPLSGDEDDDPDPFGLFHDKPYQESEDSDDDEFDDDDDDVDADDWDEDEERR